MKINNDGAGAISNATDPLARTKAEQGGSDNTRPAAGAAADAVKLSPEAQFLKTMADQSVGEPAIRQDVVDRMKALLDAGKVGHDAGALADAMIDDLTNER